MMEMTKDPRELAVAGNREGTKDVDAARAASVQERATTGRGRPGLSLFLWAAGGGTDLIPPWWSRSRDAELRKFWRRIDHLAGAVYTMESLISTIPLRVEALDPTVQLHKRQAEEFTTFLMEEADFGEGWGFWVQRWVEDHVTQDNGAFAEVLGDGPPDGPIFGPALGLAHLDSYRCTRTGHPEFPVLFMDTNGNQSKLHRSRVMMSSSMPSPASEMNGVGFCAVSRCVNVAQTLLDMMVYRQEKLGSRPSQGILVTKGGLDPDDVNEAFQVAEQTMDNQLLRRYGKFVVMGDSSLIDAGIDKVELTGLPEGFNEKEATGLAMAAIALAFGTDPRELFPGMTIGATRAEALIAHLKQRGKGPGQLLQNIERGLNAKFLPPHLKAVFDFQDDAQDEQRADIKTSRATRRTEELGSEVLDVRGAREIALEEEDLSEAQFADLELRDGRLPNGDSVLTLFYRGDYAEHLDLGVVDPVNVGASEAGLLKESIKLRRAELMTKLEAAGDSPRRRPIVESLAALDALEKGDGERTKPKPPPVLPAPPVPGERPGEPAEPGAELERTQVEGAEHMPGPEDMEMDKRLTVYDPADALLAEAVGLLRSVKRDSANVVRVGPGEVPDLRPIIVQGPDMQPVADAVKAVGASVADGLRNMPPTQVFVQTEELAAATDRQTKALQSQVPPTVIVQMDELAGSIRDAFQTIGKMFSGMVDAVRDQQPPSVTVNLPETPVSLEVIMPASRTTKKIVRDALGRADTIIEETTPE